MSFVSCKKTEIKYEHVSIDKDDPDKVYGAFLVTMSVFKAVDSSFISVNANFFKAPYNEFPDYPTFSEIGCREQQLFATSTSGYDTYSSLGFNTELFKKFNIHFNSPQLGNCNFAETDTVFPIFSSSITNDTLVISKSSGVTFTVINSAPAFVGSVCTTITRHLKPGVNVIQIYPEEIKNFLNGQSIGLVFSKNTSCFMNSRRFMYTREYRRFYGIKLTN